MFHELCFRNGDSKQIGGGDREERGDGGMEGGGKWVGRGNGGKGEGKWGILREGKGGMRGGEWVLGGDRYIDLYVYQCNYVLRYVHCYS